MTRQQRRATPVNAVVRRQADDEWVGTVVSGLNREDRTRQLLSLLGSDEAVERFKTVALHAIVHDTKLREADPLSVIEAVREAATLSLEPTGVLGEAWILPYKGTARLSVGYRGYLKLIRRSRAVSFVDTQIVYMNDRFDIQFGTDPRIVHVPLLYGERGEDGALLSDRGSYRGAYAWAELVGTPRPMIEWMTLEDIEQVRKASPSVIAGRSSPWDNWYGEMARKSPIRRLAKRLPLDPVAERALAVDDETADAEAEALRPAGPALTGRAGARAARDQRQGYEAPGEPDEPSDAGPVDDLTEDEKAAAIRQERAEAGETLGLNDQPR
jgi:recombination protein RecT